MLRAFERELGANVIRPAIAGLMGAYGAALYSKKCKQSAIIGRDELKNFEHTSKPAVCNGCGNHCALTVNTFSGGKRFVSGNRCEKALGVAADGELPNLHEFKRNYLTSLACGENRRGKTVGLPLALGMFELLPLWHGIFTSLGFGVKVSKMSDRRTYEKGQFSIPSDTACYPAKIMHGHIYELLKSGVDMIFYPCLSYNVDEKSGDNHYNCPIVAYYSELLDSNIDDLENVDFFYPFLNINSKKELTRELARYLPEHFGKISKAEIKKAVDEGFRAYDKYMSAIRAEGERALRYAEQKGKRIMILAGRPYHIDSEIGHGIDKLATSLGFVVVSEDSVCHLAEKPEVRVLNQWTYHSRLYKAAQYAVEHKNTELVQLVSFGCGVDAITTDEVRSILERGGKYYTQLKIDEITNLGAVKIRLRSLIGALDEKEAE